MDNESIYGTSDITIKKYSSFTGGTSALINATGNSVISGVVIDATGFSKAVNVVSGTTAVRNGANISGAGTGIFVAASATAELNRSSISGTNYSVMSLGTVTTQMSNSADSVSRQTLNLGAPVYSRNTFNAESGEIRYSGSSNISKFIEIADGNFNLSGAVVTGNNLATNVISASSSGKINISGGTITGAGACAIYTNNIINFQFTSSSSTCNINGTVYLEHKGNIAVGSSLASVSNTIKVMCSSPEARTQIGTYAGMLSASYADKFEYATTSYSITPDDTTHTLKLYANKATLPVTPGIVGSLSSLETNVAGETVTTITDADLEGKTYYKTDEFGTYVLDVSRIDIPVRFNGGGTVRIAKDITIGGEGYISVTEIPNQTGILEGADKGITITCEGSILPICASSGANFTLKNITLVGAESQTSDDYAFSLNCASLCLENVTIKDLKTAAFSGISLTADTAEDAVLNNVVIDNIQCSDFVDLGEVSLQNCCVKKAIIANDSIFPTSVVLRPEGTISLRTMADAYYGTVSGMTLIPQEGYSITKYSVNSIEQTIPTTETTVGLAGDEYASEPITSVLVEVAEASKDPAMTLTTSAKDLKVGDEVTVNVDMENITAAGQGTFEYSSNLELQSITKGSALSGDKLEFYTVEGKPTFGFNNNAGTTDGTVAVATFKCTKAGNATVSLANAVAGKSGETDDIDVAVTNLDSLSIGLAPKLKGDVNNNGKLNVVDAQVVYDMANGTIYAEGTDSRTKLINCWDPETTGATYELIEGVANVNGDDKVDAVDAYAILVAAVNGGFATE